jgi:hypothetical protein
VLPSKYFGDFGANAAWLQPAVIAYNVLTALKRLALPADVLTARPKRAAIFDFPYPGSTDASCSTAEFATGNGYRRTGHVPGGSPIIAASWLGEIERVLIDGFAERLFASASKNRRPSASRWTSQMHALRNNQEKAFGSGSPSHQLALQAATYPSLRPLVSDGLGTSDYPPAWA